MKQLREKIEVEQSRYTGLQNQTDYGAGIWKGYENVLKMIDDTTLHSGVVFALDNAESILREVLSSSNDKCNECGTPKDGPNHKICCLDPWIRTTLTLIQETRKSPAEKGK